MWGWGRREARVEGRGEMGGERERREGGGRGGEESREGRGGVECSFTPVQGCSNTHWCGSKSTGKNQHQAGKKDRTPGLDLIQGASLQ